MEGGGGGGGGKDLDEWNIRVFMQTPW